MNHRFSSLPQPSSVQFCMLHTLDHLCTWLCLLNPPSCYLQIFVKFCSVQTFTELLLSFFCPGHVTISTSGHIQKSTDTITLDLWALAVFTSSFLLHWVSLTHLVFPCPWSAVSTCASYIFPPFLPSIHYLSPPSTGASVLSDMMLPLSHSLLS